MPMKLRDGKIYTPQKSVHMLLRDGKLVDARQQVIYNERKRFSNSFSSSPGKRKKHNLHLETGSLIRENCASSSRLFSQSNTTCSEMADMHSATAEENAQKIVKEIQMVETVKGIEKQQTVRTNSFEKINQIEVFSVEDDSGFITSTPLLHSTATTDAEPDGSFTFPKTNTTSFQILEDKDTVKSFTHVRTKEAHVLSTPTTTDYGTKLLSKRPNGDAFGVEQHIFEDLSKSLLYSYLSDDLSDSEINGDQTDFPSFKRKSLSYPHMDHAWWGKCHDWRRQWYLNRWNIDYTKFQKRSWISTFIQTIITTVTTFQSLIFSRISTFFSYFMDHGQSAKVRNRRLKRLSTTSIAQKSWFYGSFKEIKKTSRQCFSFFFIPLCICLLAIVLAFLFIPSLKEHKVALNLTEHGLKNAYSMRLGYNPEKMPMWHVFPEGKAINKDKQSFDNGFPIIFYLRDPDTFQTKERIEIFKVLSDAGYNIVTPVYAETGRRIIEPWKFVHKAANGSPIYFWGDKMDAGYMSDLAKDLCKEGVPPSGVIIITDVFDNELPAHSYEVWSCNCSAVLKENGTPFAYTHIKCPVSNANIQRDITECLQALNK